MGNRTLPLLRARSSDMQDDWHTHSSCTMARAPFSSPCCRSLYHSVRSILDLSPVFVSSQAYRLADLGDRPMLTMTVGKETAAIRPYVVCAVLRDV